MPTKANVKDMFAHRALTIAAGLPVVLVSLLGFIFPSDIFFWFISSNLFVEITRLAIVGMLLWISFNPKFRSHQMRNAYKLIGAGLIVFSVATIALPAMDYQILNVIKPLDYLVAMELGILTLMSAVLYPVKRGRKANLHLWPALPKIRPWATANQWRLRQT